MTINIDSTLNVYSIHLVGLMCRFYSNSYFKMLGGQGPIGMIIMRLIHIIWYQYNEVDRKIAHSGGKGD